MYDDAIDAFGVHAVGGFVGGLLTGCFATSTIAGGTPPRNVVFYGSVHVGGHQLAMQLYGCVVTAGWSAVLL